MDIILQNLKSFEDKISEVYKFFESSALSKKPGKADPGLISNIFIESYGSKVPLSNLASISAIDSSKLSIKVYDKELIKSIDKALWESKLGTVQASSTDLIFQIPPVTGESIDRVLKSIKDLLEKTKTSMRNIRRDSLEAVKEFKKTHEDTYKKHEIAIQKILDNYTKKSEDLLINIEKNIKKT